MRKKGWDSLDRRLLKHPEVAKTQFSMRPSVIDCESTITSVRELGASYDGSATAQTPLAPRGTNLDTSKGYAHEIRSDMFNYSVSNFEVEETANKWKEEGKH